DTFPPIKQDGDAFVATLAEKDIRGKALKPGEILRLP
ncbi:metal-dependent hydrolase, partial [Mesorhizobium sp. M00.F.Ca.ET.186.01.1.1]